MQPPRTESGFSMIELLCVVAIILILIGLMLGPIMKAYKKAKRLGEDSKMIPVGGQIYEFCHSCFIKFSDFEA
jgi:prepilin-type N-terminal cleavage/methylation domain-containing protein